MGIPNAIIVPFEPPAIRGVGSVGGFQFEVKDEGNHDFGTLSPATQAIIMKGNKYSCTFRSFFEFYSQ